MASKVIIDVQKMILRLVCIDVQKIIWVRLGVMALAVQRGTAKAVTTNPKSFS